MLGQSERANNTTVSISFCCAWPANNMTAASKVHRGDTRAEGAEFMLKMQQFEKYG